MRKTLGFDEVMRIEKYVTRLREDIVTFEKTGNEEVYRLIEQYIRIIQSICRDFLNND